MPPCAHAVDPSDSPPFAITATRLPAAASVNAAVRPAAPEPMIRASKVSVNGTSPRQIEEDVFEVGLARRDVDDAETCRADCREHVAGIRLRL